MSTSDVQSIEIAAPFSRALYFGVVGRRSDESAGGTASERLLPCTFTALAL